MGSVTRGNRGERFITEFQEDAVGQAPAPGTSLVVERRYLAFVEGSEDVRCVLELNGPDGTLHELWLPQVFFDPERDPEFESESVAGILGIEHEQVLVRTGKADLL